MNTFLRFGGPVQLDIWSDVACPWCFVGKKRLERALAAPGAPEVTVRWHAFQLSPDLPAAGVDAKEWLHRRMGEARSKQIHDHLAAIGRDVGIPFQFDRRERLANTRLAHRIVAILRPRGHEDAAIEGLFAAQFVDGVDFSSQDALIAYLAGRGIPMEGVAEALARGEGNAEVDADLAQARQIGVTGVPFFVADRKIAMSGAQPEATFLEFFEAAIDGPIGDAP